MVSIAVIGLGNFGCRVLDELIDSEADIIIIDRDREIVEKYKERVRDAYITDAINQEALKKMIPDDIDSVVVDLGGQLESSILVTNYLHKFGVRRIIVKAKSDEQGEILKDEKGNAKFRMTAVINGESISHEITQKQYDKFMAIDDYHRMKLFSHIFKEVDMKTIPGEGKNIGAQIGGALLAGLAVMSELGRDRPAPAVFVEHHHDHAHGPHVYFKGSVDSPQDLASRAFDAGLNAGEHGVGLGHGR